MKLFYLIAFLVLAAVAQADVSDKSEQKSPDLASDKSSDSKPKRDASFLGGGGGSHGGYHGPSYKYLPPSSVASSYDSYSSPGLSSAGHHRHAGFHGHQSGGLGGVKFVGVSHGIGGFPASYAPSASYGGHGSGGFAGGFGHAIKSSGPSYVVGHAVAGGLGHGVHSFGGHGFSSGPKVISAGPSYSLSAGHVGSGSGLAAGYHYSKGISGSLGSAGGHGGFSLGSGVGHGVSGGHGASGVGHGGFSGSSGSGHGVSGYSSGSGHGISGFGAGAVSGFSSQGDYSSGHEVHHSDHVHNGNQEHHYIVGASQDSGPAGDSGYHYEAPVATYLPPAIPSSSYGLPISAVSATYSPSYQNSLDEGPVYAAGHKGLGHFSFTSNKPNVLHTNIIGSSFKTPSYSKVPFKPSTFLGSKFEGSSASSSSSAAGVDQAPNQQYLPPSSGAQEASGYDYPIPSGATLEYHDGSYQSAGEVGNHQQPEANYLPPHHDSSAGAGPSASYLPPGGSSYGH
uniref:Uncharacterized protein n=1 Tax=Musca domestica TaxID=7370 RepID=A0A1I8MQU7_MUSDO